MLTKLSIVKIIKFFLPIAFSSMFGIIVKYGYSNIYYNLAHKIDGSLSLEINDIIDKYKTVCIIYAFITIIFLFILKKIKKIRYSYKLQFITILFLVSFLVLSIKIYWLGVNGFDFISYRDFVLPISTLIIPFLNKILNISPENNK